MTLPSCPSCAGAWLPRCWFKGSHLYTGSRKRVRLAALPVAILPNSSSTRGLPSAAAASWWPSIQRSEKPVSA